MTARAKETHSDLAAAPPRSASEQGESGRALTVPGSGKGLGGDLATPISLAALLPTLQHEPAFDALQHNLSGSRPGEDPIRLSIADPAKPYAIAALHQALGRTVVVLTARPGTARQLWEDLLVWGAAPGAILHFPAPDALPYEHLAEDPSLVARRVDVLAHLAEPGGPPLVVACLRAVMDLVDPPAHFRAASRTLKLG